MGLPVPRRSKANAVGQEHPGQKTATGLAASVIGSPTSRSAQRPPLTPRAASALPVPLQSRGKGARLLRPELTVLTGLAVSRNGCQTRRLAPRFLLRPHPVTAQPRSKNAPLRTRRARLELRARALRETVVVVRVCVRASDLLPATAVRRM